MIRCVTTSKLCDYICVAILQNERCVWGYLASISELSFFRTGILVTKFCLLCCDWSAQIRYVCCDWLAMLGLLRRDWLVVALHSVCISNITALNEFKIVFLFTLANLLELCLYITKVTLITVWIVQTVYHQRPVNQSTGGGLCLNTGREELVPVSF